MRVFFAGADASVKSRTSAEPSFAGGQPPNPRAQLRLTFSRRRKTNTEEPNSVERGAHRRKAPAPMRVCFAGADASAELTSEENLFVGSLRSRLAHSLFVGGQHPIPRSAPANILSTGGETDYRRATPPLRRALTGGKHQLLSGLCFAGADASARYLYLRRALARRRTASVRALSSGQRSVTGGQQITGTPPPTRALFVGACGTDGPALRLCAKIN